MILIDASYSCDAVLAGLIIIIIFIIIIIIVNDQFTPSGLEAYTGANGSLFKAVHACWHSFYLPRKDGRLSEL